MRYVFLIFYLFFGITYANDQVSFSTSDKLMLENFSKVAILEEENKRLENNYKKLSKEYNNLLVEIQNIKQQATDNKSNLSIVNTQIKPLINDSSTGMSFEVWIGILLACVATIVTGLGVVIALLALWGYKNIKNSAIEGAVDESEFLVREAIETGHFNELIDIAVNRVIYRGILSENDFPEIDEEGEINESL